MRLNYCQVILLLEAPQPSIGNQNWISKIKQCLIFPLFNIQYCTVFVTWFCVKVLNLLWSKKNACYGLPTPCWVLNAKRNGFVEAVFWPLLNFSIISLEYIFNWYTIEFTLSVVLTDIPIVRKFSKIRKRMETFLSEIKVHLMENKLPELTMDQSTFVVNKHKINLKQNTLLGWGQSKISDLKGLSKIFCFNSLNGVLYINQKLIFTFIPSYIFKLFSGKIFMI